MTRSTKNSGKSSGDSISIEDLSADSQYIVSYMENKFEVMKKEFYDLLAAKNSEIDSLKCEVASLTSLMKKLEYNVDESDAYNRRETVVVSGDAVHVSSPNENCSELLSKLFSEELNINISKSDISTAHRLGRKRENVPDKRSIIVKFCRRDTKSQAILVSRQRRNSKVFVNESLTPSRRVIFNALRKMKREHQDLVKGCSTYDGNIYANTKSTNHLQRDQRHLVNTRETLTEFCRNFVKKPLELFLANFQE